MKNIQLLYAFLIISSLFFACEKEPPIHTAPNVEEPQDTLPQTVNLLPYKYLPSDTTDGRARANWQDSFLWVAGGYALQQDWHTTHPDDYFTIQWSTNEPLYNFLREQIYMTELPLNETGEFKISGDTRDLDDDFIGAKLFTLMDGGDVTEDNYRVDEDAEDNQLDILEVDTINQIYRGTFTVSFSISTVGGKKNPDNPDHVKIKDAEFWAKVIE